MDPCPERTRVKNIKKQAKIKGAETEKSVDELDEDFWAKTMAEDLHQDLNNQRSAWFRKNKSKIDP